MTDKTDRAYEIAAALDVAAMKVRAAPTPENEADYEALVQELVTLIPAYEAIKFVHRGRIQIIEAMLIAQGLDPVEAIKTFEEVVFRWKAGMDTDPEAG